MEDKVIVITGGGSGIGRATALLFAGRGVKVAVADIDESGGKETVKMIEQAGGKASFVPVDVTVEEQVKAMVERIVEAYGRMDYAFNNAGTMGNGSPLHLSKTEDWLQTLALNLTSVYLCLKYETVYMMAHGGGAIVNTASCAGVMACPGLAAYGASKAGVIGLTRAAAQEYLPSGIRVNAVLPTFVKTPMLNKCLEDSHIGELAKMATSMAPVGEPDQIAEAVYWLCSDKASFVSGHSMILDGGANPR